MMKEQAYNDIQIAIAAKHNLYLYICLLLKKVKKNKQTNILRYLFKLSPLISLQ